VVERAILEGKALFLDEVHTLDEPGQQALLPLLELPERRFMSLVGPVWASRAPLHILLGTNVEVQGRKWDAHFRPDLWYRMSRVHIHLPALSERGPEVVYQYLARMLESAGTPAPETVFDIRALHVVTRHTWPGNLRELEGFAREAASVWRRKGRALDAKDLIRCRLALDSGRSSASKPVIKLEDVELEAVLSMLRETGWSQSQAARRLGINKWAVRRILARAGLLEEVKRQRRRVEID
jgi:DNA-binding NtrC family response regulator